MAAPHIVVLLMVSCALFALANGNFTLPFTLVDHNTNCIDECDFSKFYQSVTLLNKNDPKQADKGVVYYTTPIRMKDPATKTVASFKTSFTFREIPMNYNESTPIENLQRADGFVFMMPNSDNWTDEPGGHFGVFTSSDNSRVVAIAYDSWGNSDTDPNLRQAEHVALDVASATSRPECFAYVHNTTGITFWHRDVPYSWIEYDGAIETLQVRVANTSTRPLNPLENCSYNLYDAVDEKMWIGFSGAHGVAWFEYMISNCTFTSFGISSNFSISSKSRVNVGLIAGAGCGVFLLVLIAVVCVWMCLRKKSPAQCERDTEASIEMAGMPGFISYKHLRAATKQFSDSPSSEKAGWERVPRTGVAVAVKKVSNGSRQGEKEFLAKVQIISQLRHRNVVELIGFCRDRGKFLLVYELLPNGSLDQALFKPRCVLSWSQRWKIIAGTAAALHYLHEGWRQQVIHRDVKSSNIVLDEEFNPKLGDFGLARLVDHQKSAATTMLAGTYGYIAPEAAGGKFTDKTDVYAFGAVALEVACGRKAYDPSSDELVLVDMVWGGLKEGALLSVADPLLGEEFDGEQMEVVLKLGLMCLHPDRGARPSMRQVVQVLAGDVEVPEVPEVASLASDKPRLCPADLWLSSRSSGQELVSGEVKRSVASTSSPSSSTFCSSAGVGTTQLCGR